MPPKKSFLDSLLGIGTNDPNASQKKMDGLNVGLSVGADIIGAATADEGQQSTATGGAVGGGIGAAAGMVLGGPVGAQVGQMLGGTIGKLIGQGADRRKADARYENRTQRKNFTLDLMENVDPYGSQFEEGGMAGGPQAEEAAPAAPPKRMINIQLGELLSDKDGNVVQDFKNRNRFSKHTGNVYTEPVGNFVEVDPEHIVIPVKHAKTFQEGDQLTRRSIIRKLIDQQVQNPHINDMPGNTPHMAEGGIPGPNDPLKPMAPVYTTQEEVDAANAQARSFMKRRYDGANMVVSPDEVTVASRPGDPKVQYYNEKGVNITGQPDPGARKALYRLPNGITANDVKSHEGEYWFDDPHTGDAVFVHPSALAGTKHMEAGGMAGGGDPTYGTKLLATSRRLLGAGPYKNPKLNALLNISNELTGATPGSNIEDRTAELQGDYMPEANGVASQTAATDPVETTGVNGGRKSRLDAKMVARNVAGFLPGAYQMANTFQDDRALRPEYVDLSRAKSYAQQMPTSIAVDDQLMEIDNTTAAALNAVQQTNSPSARAEAANIVSQSARAKAQVIGEAKRQGISMKASKLNALMGLETQEAGNTQAENIRVQNETRADQAQRENVRAGVLDQNYRMFAGTQNDMEKINAINHMSKFENIDPYSIQRYVEDPGAREYIFNYINAGGRLSDAIAKVDQMKTGTVVDKNTAYRNKLGVLTGTKQEQTVVKKPTTTK